MAHSWNKMLGSEATGKGSRVVKDGLEAKRNKVFPGESGIEK